jgi:hypothetical protein
MITGIIMITITITIMGIRTIMDMITGILTNMGTGIITLR